MRCPECKSKNVREISNLHTIWGCGACGYQGDGADFEARRLPITYISFQAHIVKSEIPFGPDCKQRIHVLIIREGQTPRVYKPNKARLYRLAFILLFWSNLKPEISFLEEGPYVAFSLGGGNG